jgi:hypothetical protein
MIDKDEKDILEAYDTGELVSSGTGGVLKKYQKYAEYTLEKTRNINIRLSEKTLLGIKRKAVEEGIPYQTLVSSILHKYVTNTASL